MGDRLWHTLMEMAKIGPGLSGGNRRLALTDEDIKGRELFQKWAAECGLYYQTRYHGQHFCPQGWGSPGMDPVLSGSHLDTQPAGGRFDGILGVLGALEVVRSLNDHGD